MFITFEGIDFCGKSTQVQLLRDYLIEQKKEVLLIREPGGTGISEKIREILLDKKNNEMVMETEIFLFSASRAQLVREVIRPHLQKGYYVISDRFHDSSKFAVYLSEAESLYHDRVRAHGFFDLFG
nr:dTMP kinase [Ignavibacterium sp.]